MQLCNTVSHIFQSAVHVSFFDDKQIGFAFEDAEIRKVLCTVCRAMSVNDVCRCIMQGFRW